MVSYAAGRRSMVFACVESAAARCVTEPATGGPPRIVKFSAYPITPNTETENE
jgi:hypothetical protein